MKIKRLLKKSNRPTAKQAMAMVERLQVQLRQATEAMMVWKSMMKDIDDLLDSNFNIWIRGCRGRPVTAKISTMTSENMVETSISKPTIQELFYKIATDKAYYLSGVADLNEMKT